MMAATKASPAPVVRGGRISVSQYKQIGKNAGAEKKRGSEEEDTQILCMEWVSLHQRAHPALRWLNHTPNGGKRTRAEAGRLKAMGVRSGFPDLTLHKRSGIWMGLAIEMKTEVGMPSSDQIEWLRHFHSEGYITAICRSLDEFIEVVRIYLAGEFSTRLSAGRFQSNFLGTTV